MTQVQTPLSDEWAYAFLRFPLATVGVVLNDHLSLKQLLTLQLSLLRDVPAIMACMRFA